MGRKLLKTVQTITIFWNPLADPVGTRRGPPLVRGPQFENRCYRQHDSKNVNDRVPTGFHILLRTYKDISEILLPGNH